MADIIFICNANMCRSPMAEGILKKKCSEQQLNVTVSSMGIHAQDQRKATEPAVTVCLEQGIDISQHHSRPLMPDELKKSRFIFTMEPVQVDYIDIFFPQVSDRLYMLSTWPERKSKRMAIPDPVGKSIDMHRKIFGKINEYITIVLPMIAKVEIR